MHLLVSTGCTQANYKESFMDSTIAVAQLQQEWAAKPGCEIAPEAIINNAARLHDVFEVGDAAHQGDIIIVRIKELPASVKPSKERQLVVGTTMGSRHIVERGDVFDADPAEVSEAIHAATKKKVDARYCGKVFVAPAEPTADDVSHPEHGNQGFPAGSICAVVGQRSYDQLLGERRVEE